MQTRPAGKEEDLSGRDLAVYVDAKGGWLDDADPLKESEESFSAYDTRSTDRRNKEEWQLYDQYYVEYIENEWFAFLIDWLSTELFSDFEFTGEGAEEAYKFFNETCPNAREEILLMGLNVVREGTGMLKKNFVNGDLKQIKAVNGRLVRLALVDKKGDPQRTANTVPDATATWEEGKWLQITIFGDNKFKEYMKEWPLDKPEDYRNELVALCRIRRDARTPYGLSFASSCLHAIKALKDVNRDVLAAVKQNASNLKVVSVDLSDKDTDDAKLTALKKVANAYRRISNATTGILAIDKNNELYYMGTGAKGQGGASGSRIIPVMKHIEPVLSAVLMNFLFSLGLIEQEGANKSLIAKQELRAERQMKRYKAAVANFLQTQILSHITYKEVRVMFEPQLEIVEWIALYQQNAISRERLLEEFSIRDEGKTYAYQSQPQPAAGATSIRLGQRQRLDNNDDSTSRAGGRQEARSDTMVGRGS